jgi:hypothetical protein
LIAGGVSSIEVFIGGCGHIVYTNVTCCICETYGCIAYYRGCFDVEAEIVCWWDFFFFPDAFGVLYLVGSDTVAGEYSDADVAGALRVGLSLCL